MVQFEQLVPDFLAVHWKDLVEDTALSDTALVMLLFFAFFGFPMIVCAYIGYAKGRHWYWFLLFGLLSILGLLIASNLPVRKRKDDEFDHSIDCQVKLFVQPAPDTCQRLGAVTVEERTIADQPERLPIHAPMHEFDLSVAAAALRLKAATLGANAVERVEFLRKKPNYWSFQPVHRIIARGTAVVLPQEIHQRSSSNAEEFWRGKEAVDPERELHDYLIRSGVSTLFLAGLSGILAITGWLEHPTSFSPLDLLIIWLVIEAILLFIRQVPGMLLIDGITLLLFGILQLTLHDRYIQGIALIASGGWSLLSYANYGRYLAQYRAVRQEFERIASNR